MLKPDSATSCRQDSGATGSARAAFMLHKLHFTQVAEKPFLQKILDHIRRP